MKRHLPAVAIPAILAITLSGLLAAAPHPVPDKAPGTARPFPPGAVVLRDGPFKDAMDLNAEYLLRLEPDRFLASVRREAGLEPKAPLYGGWERDGIASHSLGHYLSALARYFALTGHPEFRKRAAYIVSEMALCQKANGSGYAAGIPDGEKILAEVSRGEIRSAGFDLNGIWVPWYTIHKLLAGLHDVHVLTGNDQAREVLVAFAGYCWEVVEDLDDAQMQRVLACEHGGMNEVAADIHALTGDPRFLEMAHKFHHRAVLGPLAAREDRLRGLHANTQVPKVIGCARIHELTGDPRHATIASFFWERVARHYSYANGGNSYNEHFGEADKFSGTLHDTTETCNSYNMLKLTSHLFRQDQRAELMDYYERVMLNHILAHQHPETGMFVYKGFLDPGARKGFSTPFDSFWCCVGTGMENHGRYADDVWFHGENALWLNLFVNSKLTWKDQALAITQETGFPFRGNVALHIAAQDPTELTLHVRIPAWATGPVPVLVNDAPHATSGRPGTYLAIRRTWNDGDRITLDLPMALRAEPMPDDPGQVAFLHGPTLLCAVHNDRDTPPPLVGAAKDPSSKFTRVDGAVPEFTAPGAADTGTIRLRPHFQVADDRYSVYLRQFSPDDWNKQLARIAATEEQERRLKAATTDFFQPGEMQPERDHDLTGHNIRTGRHNNRPWRDADNGWMRFSMQSDPGEAMTLVCTWWGDDAGNRHFDILAEDRQVATVKLDRPAPGRFVDQHFPLPAELTRGKDRITIELRAHPGHIAGGIFGARLARSSQLPAVESPEGQQPR